MNFDPTRVQMRRHEYQRLFQRENAFLERAQGADGTRPDYDEMVSAYDQLLRQTVRLIQTGDNIEKQLIEAKAALRQEIESKEQLNQRLRKANEEKDNFVGIASHDLRSPLSALYSLVNLLYDEGEAFEPELRQDLLGTARDSIVRMMELVDHLLDLNKLERGLHEVHLQEVDLLPICLSLASCLRVSAELKQIALVEDFPDEVPEFRSSASNIDRILENFLSNAIKYSPPGKTVTFGCREGPTGVRLWVQDQGPGISAEDRQRLFQPFQRLSAQPTGGESASGLGLAIAQGLAQEINATITVDSEPGHGACFALEIPVHREARVS
jgi:signal transduction histidine kinase